MLLPAEGLCLALPHNDYVASWRPDQRAARGRVRPRGHDLGGPWLHVGILWPVDRRASKVPRWIGRSHL